MLDECMAARRSGTRRPFTTSVSRRSSRLGLISLLGRGKTFAYGVGGPAGPGRRQAGHVAIARGDFYESETAAISAEHPESYMRTVLSFIGVNNPEFVLGQCMEVTVGAASVMPSPRNLCGQCWEM
jgi:FMN-dependent NADH-azoreductase